MEIRWRVLRYLRNDLVLLLVGSLESRKVAVSAPPVVPSLFLFPVYRRHDRKRQTERERPFHGRRRAMTYSRN